MLVLNRRPLQSVVLSNGVEISIVKVKGQDVRLSLKLPDDVLALRDEHLQPGETVADALARYRSQPPKPQGCPAR